MSLPSHVEWIASHMGGRLQAELDRQGAGILVHQALAILCEADPSPKEHAVQWMVDRLLDGGFLWEDVQVGVGSKVHETLSMLQVHRLRVSVQDRRLENHSTLASVWKAVEPFAVKVEDDDVPGIRERRRQEKAAAYAESIILCERPGLTVAVPLTEAASKWWGRGTRWCTAAERGNAFAAYDRTSPLIVIVLPNAKLQMYVIRMGSMLMDETDTHVTPEFVAEHWDSLSIPILWALPKDPSLLRYVPVPLRDHRMCMSALRNNPRSFIEGIMEFFSANEVDTVLDQIPEKFRTRAVCRYAVRCSGRALQFVPQEWRSRALCRKAVSGDGLALKFVPLPLRSRRMCLKAISSDAQAHHYFPEELKTPRMLFKVLKRDGMSIRSVPEAMLTPQLCKVAVSGYGLVLGFISQKFRDKDTCMQALKKGCSLEQVPEAIRDKKMSLIAVKKRGLDIEFVPKGILDYGMCLMAVEKDPEAIQFVPNGFLDRRMHLAAVSRMGMHLKKVPPAMRDRKMCLLAVSRNGMALEFVPDSMRDRVVCAKAMSKSPLALAFVPEALRDLDMCTRAVQVSGAEIEFVPQAMLSHDLCVAALRNWPDAIHFIPQSLYPEVVAALEGQPRPEAANPETKPRAWSPDTYLDGLKTMLE